MAKRGRKSKYEEIDLPQVKILCQKGFTDQELADFYSVSKVTINNWKKQHKEFLYSLKEGKAEADRKVEMSLFERATGYYAPDIHFSAFEGIVTETEYIKHWPPDTTAAIFWLKNRKPDEWRDKDFREVEGSININVTRNIIKKS